MADESTYTLRSELIEVNKLIDAAVQEKMDEAIVLLDEAKVSVSFNVMRSRVREALMKLDQASGIGFMKEGLFDLSKEMDKLNRRSDD